MCVLSLTNVEVNAFYQLIFPQVSIENKLILVDRLKIIKLESNWKNLTLSDDDFIWLSTIAKRYRLVFPSKSSQLTDMHWHSLLSRVDVVPNSLVLVQAGHESHYGTSRFARVGNNLFGMRCYRQGCGVLPKYPRAEEGRYEVASYVSVNKSISAYLLNLNSNAPYERFRQLRKHYRSQTQQLSGDLLVDGLLPYSSEGSVYVNKMKLAIKQHNLLRYDFGFG